MEEGDDDICILVDTSSKEDKLIPVSCNDVRENCRIVERTRKKYCNVGNDLSMSVSEEVILADKTHGIQRKINGEVEIIVENKFPDINCSADITDYTFRDRNELISGSVKPYSYKRKLQLSPVPEEVKGTVRYKGFKKKYLSQQSQALSSKTSHQGSPRASKGKKTSKKVVESQVLVSHETLTDEIEPSTPLTEYAQYLGLQPTVKFKCYKCGETGFPSMYRLQEHQNSCLTNYRMQSYSKPPLYLPIEPTPSTNFRITRKVYLCSACGTYYENWNLFLHMREVHNRHICLYCLGMFSQADKLRLHLTAKHGVRESSYGSSDQFLSDYKGGCFLMCCTCEQMFTERDNFFDHICAEVVSLTPDRACSLCGLRGAHFPTCRRAFTDSNSLSPTQFNIPRPVSFSNSSETPQYSQLAVQENSVSVSKYLVPVEKVYQDEQKSSSLEHELIDEIQSKVHELASDCDDDYDISDAASYCHVNIHEPLEKQQPITSQVEIYKTSITRQDVESKAPSPPVIVIEPVEEEKPIAPLATEVEKNDKEDDDDVICLTKLSEFPSNKLDEDDDSVIACDDVADTSNSNSIEIQVLDTVQPVKVPVTPPPVVEEETKDCIEVKNDSPVTIELIDQETTKSEERSSPEIQILEPEGDDHSKKPSISEIKIEPQMSPKPDTNVSQKTPSATDSESDSSDSGGESHDSDVSSSSSDASSDENDQQEKKQQETTEKPNVSEESDVDNGDSDKMSLVVDENRSEEENESVKEQCTEDAVSNIIKENEVTEQENEEQSKPKNDCEQHEEVIHDVEETKPLSNDKDQLEDPSDNIQIAGDDVPILELTLEENVDVLPIQTLIKECVKISCSTCVYCNHAKKIAVNGKQLVLHLLAEHRFEPVVCSNSGELTAVEGFIERLKAALPELQDMYFNTDTYDSSDKTLTRPYDRTYECFHCNFTTTLHKELYVHNRKMHQKTILLCIMCKSNFYSYSELLCHLCPGIYVPDSNIIFRCCLCVVDGLPSAFRLMVHLRKRHHACDVCLETTGDQQKLSNHVWKHKLHHLCYRCGIAYRNKPDITKHLFWKHGTESVLCKKCLQKKWPHVYHFCIPPNAFVCEECNASFSRAVALKVHKRLHGGDLPYMCEECEERFISRKLLAKHQEKHKTLFVKKAEDPIVDDKIGCNQESEFEDDIGRETELTKDTEMDSADVECKDDLPINEADASDTSGEGLLKAADKTQIEVPTTEAMTSETDLKPERDADGKKAKVLDVYDLPPLNLSSESDDSDYEETCKSFPFKKEEEHGNTNELSFTEENLKTELQEKNVEENSSVDEEMPPVPVVDGIWDNFKTYKANLEKRESLQAENTEGSSYKSCGSLMNYGNCADITVVMVDHDYCQPLKTAENADSPKDESEGIQPSQETHLLEENVPLSIEKKEKLDDDKNSAFDVDHNYCSNTSPRNDENDREMPSTPAPVVPTPNKKKQKTPKKKSKHSGSSSSSDSSSNSDSSSCSCGTNCSCSSSSSSSSGSSSSQSSDSDSSSSEGRRRQAARRERRKERAKKKLEASPPKVSTPPQPIPPPELLPLPSPLPQQSPPTPTPPPQPPETTVNGDPHHDDDDDDDDDDHVVPSIIEQEETDLPIKESDLDTDETETDEDFYDKYPQKQANRLLAEKRNQLLLLAAVAPVNNGTMSQPIQSVVPETKEPIIKKKVKSKKHKKSQHQHNSSDKRENKLKLNIPASYYNNPSTFTITNSGRSSSPLCNLGSMANVVGSPQLSRIPQESFSVASADPSVSATTYHSTGSGSETDSKRLSKRKRVPKRFYGDSSDEDTDHPSHQPFKWRKVVPASGSSPHPAIQTVAPNVGFTFKSTSVSNSNSLCVPNLQEKSEDEGGDESDSEREVKRSSSESSNSDSDGDKEQDEEPSDAESETETAPASQTIAVPSCSSDAGEQKSENLYCYCQCPYDEVSEMIACDGKDCTIEWFHFECVGIMVPPKGKWFCPDCRKRSAGRIEYLEHS